MKKDEKNINIVKRLNRIEGQVRGLRQMLEKERPCYDVLKQVAAVRGALQSLGQVILQNHLDECLASFGQETKKAKEFKENIIKLFSKICSNS